MTSGQPCHAFQQFFSLALWCWSTLPSDMLLSASSSISSASLREPNRLYRPGPGPCCVVALVAPALPRTQRVPCFLVRPLHRGGLLAKRIEHFADVLSSLRQQPIADTSTCCATVSTAIPMAASSPFCNASTNSLDRFFASSGRACMACEAARRVPETMGCH